MFTLPVTPRVVPTVAVALTVNALTVVFPLDPTVVNYAVLGAALPSAVQAAVKVARATSSQ